MQTGCLRYFAYFCEVLVFSWSFLPYPVHLIQATHCPCTLGNSMQRWERLSTSSVSPLWKCFPLVLFFFFFPMPISGYIFFYLFEIGINCYHSIFPHLDVFPLCSQWTANMLVHLVSFHLQLKTGVLLPQDLVLALLQWLQVPQGLTECWLQSPEKI